MVRGVGNWIREDDVLYPGFWYLRITPFARVLFRRSEWTGEGPLLPYLISIARDAIANAAILPVDNHIGSVFSGQSLCLSNGCFLQPVFGGDALIPLPPYGPNPFIGHYMLVPGPSPFALTAAFKKELNELA